MCIQGIGFIGVALFIISYQIRSNCALFLCQLMGCIVFCVQFFLMGAYTGAISLILVHSWGGAVNEAIAILSIIISIIRFGWRNLGKETGI